MEHLDTIGEEYSYSDESEGMLIQHRFTITNEQMEQLFKDFAFNRCPVCFSIQFCDYEKATEERSKYR